MPFVRAAATRIVTALVASSLCVGLPAFAQTVVTLNGSMGDRALLIIDGQPRTVAVGASSNGVKVLSLADGSARVEAGGKVLTLRIGEAPVNVGLGAGAARASSEIVLTAGPGGHFTTAGRINGKAVSFMVDTGASIVVMSQAEADRIGLSYRSGGRIVANTANGQVPANTVVLTSVRVGDIEVANVQAAVVPAAMDQILLGNSFLSRFQMRRDNDVMRLEKRP